MFGRGGEEAQRLRAQGIAVEVVNGITAGLAAATALGVPLTHRAHAHGVIFVTGHARADGAALHCLPQQRQLVCTLDTLAAAVRAARIGSPAIVIVGDVLRGMQSLAQPRADAHAA